MCVIMALYFANYYQNNDEVNKFINTDTDAYFFYIFKLIYLKFSYNNDIMTTYSRIYNQY